METSYPERVHWSIREVLEQAQPDEELPAARMYKEDWTLAAAASKCDYWIVVLIARIRKRIVWLFEFLGENPTQLTYG